jgi:hypothetical protein
VRGEEELDTELAGDVDESPVAGRDPLPAQGGHEAGAAAGADDVGLSRRRALAAVRRRWTRCRPGVVSVSAPLVEQAEITPGRVILARSRYGTGARPSSVTCRSPCAH